MSGRSYPYDYISIGLKSSENAGEYLIHFQQREFGGGNWKNNEIKLPANTRKQAMKHFNEWKRKMDHKYQRTPKLFERKTELIFLTE